MVMNDPRWIFWPLLRVVGTAMRLLVLFVVCCFRLGGVEARQAATSEAQRVGQVAWGVGCWSVGRCTAARCPNSEP